MKSIVIILIIALIEPMIMKSLYNPLHSYVTPINKRNFENQINKIRQTTKQLSIVHYYKENDGESKEFAEHYDQWCNEYQGVFRIGSADCVEDFDVCEKEKITKFPTIKIYPPFPTPALNYEGPLEIKKLTAFAAKYMESNVVEITSESINTFINDSPAVPKAFLFTDKPKIPLIYKGLSVNFENKLFFGMIKQSEKDLLERYNIKKLPALIIVKATEKKPYYFKEEFTFKKMFEFINIFSETYVPGGGSSQDSPATKQWLTEICPEMNEKSANDICLKAEQTLCVIIIDKDKPEKQYLDLMKQLHTQYDRKIARGSQFKFMWLTSQLEPKWKEYFQITEEPSIVILNPGKRKRYVKHEGNLDFKSVQMTLERINGGDAKFLVLKNPLPDFSTRK